MEHNESEDELPGFGVGVGSGVGVGYGVGVGVGTSPPRLHFPEASV